MSDLIDAYLSDDDKAAIRQARGRQLAEQYYNLSLVVPSTEGEADQKKANLSVLEAQLQALAE